MIFIPHTSSSSLLTGGQCDVVHVVTAAHLSTALFYNLSKSNYVISFVGAMQGEKRQEKKYV